MLLQVTNIELKISQHLANIYNNRWVNFNELNLYLNNVILSVKQMAAIPQAAFAACKLREQNSYNEREMMISRMSLWGADKNAIDNQKGEREYTPVKYNGKLMNSIWGLYNRYSPHNIKKNEYAPPKY